MLVNIFVPKANHTYEIETDLLPDVSNVYSHTYGLKQCLTDPTAGVKRSDFNSDAEFHAAAKAKSDIRMGQLESGRVPGTGAVKSSVAAVIAELTKAKAESDARADAMQIELDALRARLAA